MGPGSGPGGSSPPGTPGWPGPCASFPRPRASVRPGGQGQELPGGSGADFQELHARRNGSAGPGAPVGVGAIGAGAAVPSPIAVPDLPPPARPAVTGPAVIAESDCTTWVPLGWR